MEISFEHHAVVVSARDTQTGKAVDVTIEVPDFGDSKDYDFKLWGVEYSCYRYFDDGTGGCDCNRSLWFGFHIDDPIPCSQGRFVVERAVDKKDGRFVYSDAASKAYDEAYDRAIDAGLKRPDYDAFLKEFERDGNV